MKRLLCKVFCLALILAGCSQVSNNTLIDPAAYDSELEISASERQGGVSISGAGAWFESAWAEWVPYQGAVSYNVYYKETTAADSAYKQADGMLIRPLNSGTIRVDVPGLKGGTQHTIKIVPVTADGELSTYATAVNLTVQKFDRAGFAFSSKSKNGTASGAYEDDGTLKADAEVLYITDENKDTVKMTVQKGSAAPVEYTGIVNILAAHQSAKTIKPIAIRFIGKVTRPSGIGSGSDNMVDVKYMSNVTIEGIGNDAEIYNWGFVLRELNNAEVRNLAFSQFEEDAVSIDTNNYNIWVHHNDFMIGKDMGGDKSKGDGSCDVKKSSDVTIAYNHFWESGKSSLIGLSEGTSFEFNVTMHHNFFDGSGSRHPRTRFANVHIYNNYFRDINTYGSAAARGSSLFIQNNVYENVVRPMIIASQGHDIKNLGINNTVSGTDTGSILSSEAGGNIKQSGNLFDTFSRSWFNDETYADAAKRDAGNAAVKQEAGRTVYSNFDASFAADGYPYLLDNASTVKEKVSQFAGRLKNDAGSWEPPQQSAEQKVAQVKSILAAALSGTYFTTKTETEALVQEKISEAENSFPQGVAVSFASNETAQTTTVTIISGDVSDTIIISGQTDGGKVSHAKALLSVLDDISFTPDKTAAAVKTEAEALIAQVKAGFESGVTAACVVDAAGNVVVTVSCNAVSDTITIVKPSDAQYVAYVKNLLQSAVKWNTNQQTTLKDANAAIAAALPSQYGVTAVAAADGEGVTITITKGSERDELVIVSVLLQLVFDPAVNITQTAAARKQYTVAGGVQHVMLETTLNVSSASSGKYVTVALTYSDGSFYFVTMRSSGTAIDRIYAGQGGGNGSTTTYATASKATSSSIAPLNSNSGCTGFATDTKLTFSISADEVGITFGSFDKKSAPKTNLAAPAPGAVLTSIDYSVNGISLAVKDITVTPLD